jgi:hypothetical protein
LIGAPWIDHHQRKEVIMSVEMLAYTSIAERLGFSSEAAQALLKRLRLPRRRANNGNAIMAEVNHTPMAPLFSAAIALGVALAIAPTLVLAEVVVRGNPKAVSIEAQNASVEEILVTLGNAFDVHYRSSTDLRKRLTGTYEGSLQKVVTQVLNGYDFLVATGERRIEITLLGSSAASPGATPPVPTPALPTSGGAPVPRQGLAAAPLPAPSGSVPRPGPPIGEMTRSLPLAAR